VGVQGTLQQRYAAAALQKLDWYYTPQTKRWYKAGSGPGADYSSRVHALSPASSAFLCCQSCIMAYGMHFLSL
jgi:hypothetical protein